MSRLVVLGCWALVLTLGSACGEDEAQQPGSVDGTPGACDSLACGPHARCEADSAGTPQCLCEAGYVGEGCVSCAAGYGPFESVCLPVIESSRPEPAGEHCASGGVATGRGLDINSSGTLESAEATTTEYACNAPDESAHSACADAPCGQHAVCGETGQGFVCACAAGHAGSLCAQCALGYQAGSDGSCTPIVTQAPEIEEQLGNDACPMGAYAVREGSDADGNGTLEGDEVSETTVLCKVVRTGNVTFSNLATLLEYADVTDIVGNVTITAPHLVDLAPLSSLLRIEGSLTITNSPELESLEGLSRLDSVTGGVSVTRNDALTQAGALGLRTVRGSLEIADNERLTTVELKRLQVVLGSLTISQNPLLTTLAFSSLVATGGRLMVDDNDALVAIDVLPKLRDTGSLFIRGNALLASVQGFPALETVRGTLRISENPAMSALAFPSLRAVDLSLLILDNAALPSLSGFESLTMLKGHLSISNNALLTTIAGFDALITLGGNCGGGGGFGFSPDDCFPGPTGMPPSWPGLPLPNVGELSFSGNEALTSFAGFSALKVLTGGNLFVRNSPALQTLDAFPNLEDALVQLGDLDALTSAALFSSLKTGSLRLSSLTLGPPHAPLALTLPAFQSGTLELHGPLTSLSLPSATGVTLRLSKSELTTFSAPLLTTLASLSLSNNQHLADLNGLANVTSLGSAPTIQNNPALRQCEALAFAARVSTSTTNITGNSAAACN